MSAKLAKETKMVLRSGIIAEFKTSKLSNIDSVPVGNPTAYKILTGEDTVHEFINTVQLGEGAKAQLDRWTSITLTEEWAQSYVNAVKEAPKPLFIPGHAEEGIASKERAIPDGYVTGGLVLNNVMYLRNTLVLSGSENKKALIEQTVKEIKAGMLSTSTYDYMKYKIETNQDTFEDNYFAIESVKAQSNALVEADQTGSEAAIILTSFKAGGADDERKKQGEYSMDDKPAVTNEARFVSLKNQIDTGSLAISDVATKLGITMMTSENKLALKRLEDAETAVGDISIFVAKMKESAQATFTSLKDAKIKDTFKSEELIEMAESFFSLKTGTVEEINTEVARIAGMKVFKSVQGKLAGSVNYVPGSDDAVVVESDNEAMEA